MKRLVAIGAMLLCVAQGRAGTLNVGPGGYSSIQAAIDDANDNDIVIVAAGTYRENIDFSGKAVTVRSADPNDPYVVAATIIDGWYESDSNCGSVVTFRNGEDSRSVLSGFTITGGTGSWLPVSWEFKGLCWNRCGGGVVCYNMSAPTISKNFFVNNIAGQGGGVYVYGDPVNPNDPSNPGVHVSPVITDNIFLNNAAIVEHGFAPPDDNYPAKDHGDGGAIVAFQGCDPVIANNLILENHAEWYGGGLHLRQWSDGLIENNQIVGNDAMLGAGVHITYTSSPTVRGNLIQGNIASGLGGGGIYAYYYSNPLIEQNTIMQNESANGAGIAVFWSSAPVIRNNLIARNVSGGGIRIKSSTPEIVHNTITGNYWGGVECYPGSDAVISHNIISSNRFGYGIFVDYDCEPNIGYNNVWGNGAADYGIYLPDQTGINGNISVDPGFVDSDSNDYHLNCDSKCINAGDANFSGEGLTDFDNHARVAGGRADLGADEVPAAWNITKDKQYEKIQEAVDDANDYEVILVTKGTHTGEGNRDISFAGKAVTVQSIDPNDTEVVRSTIIDCEGSGAAPHRAFQFFNQEQADSVVAGLTITNGEGFYEGGAIRCFNNSNPTIRNCVLTKNIARGRGGAIYCDRSSPTIVDCTITENTCPLGYGGGIGCYYGSEPLISNCVVANNMAEGPGRHGGGICCWDQGDAVVANCIVVGNSAWHRGGGLYAYWSRPTFVNCTVIGNRSAEGGGVGCFRESNPEVINCIVRGNRAADGNQLALISTMRVWGLEIITEMTVSHSNIEGGRPEMCVDPNMILHWGQGNIDIDANFVDLGYWDDANTPAEPNDDFFVCGNYHLLPGSGCEDAGDNNSVPVSSVWDIDGEERIFGAAVDMGADEVVMNDLDLDGDGIVDYFELGILTGEWLQGGSELESDFYDDDFVDFADLSVLGEQWLWRGGWYE